MAGHLGRPAGHGVKVLSLYPGQSELRPLKSHTGLYPAVRRRTPGLPVLCMDAAVLTAIRTAASTAVASRVLARPDSACAGDPGAGGAGAQPYRGHARGASDHAASSPGAATAPGWRRSPPPTGWRWRRVPAEAVAQADIVVTATPARAPFLTAAMLRPGQHVNAVGGSVAFMQELDADVVAAVRFVTDYRPSLEPQAAEVIAARRLGLIAADHDIPEIGEVLAGRVAGRRSDHEITLYRSLGISAQDLAAAHVILGRAEAAGVGYVVAMG
jgi:ornithine cyclodeaminase/alanine dehydrogenase-like protein (mu-crystallin family)